MRAYFFLFLFSVTTLFPQEQTKVGNLVMENVPEIPVKVKERSRQYRNIRSASFRSWDPAREGMLIATRFAETTQLHYLDHPLGARQQITFYDEPVGGGSFCPDPGTRGFLFTKDVGGSEYYQIFYYDLNTGASKMLTDGTSRNGLGPWSNNGAYFAFNSNMGNGVDMNVYLGTIHGDSFKALVQEPGYWYPLDWSPDDKRLLVGKYVSINESYLYIVDVATGTLTQVNPTDKKISYGSARFSRDGKGIYLTSDEDSEFRHLRYYDLKTGKMKLLTGHIPWNVTGFTLSDNGRMLAFVTNEDAVSRLHVINTRTRREYPLPELPMGEIYGLDFHPDNKRLSLTLNTPQTPGDVYVLQIGKRRLTRWTKSEVGGLNTENFVVPELIHITSFDGLRIPAFLYKPKGEGPFPVVVYIHGGPESQYTPYFSSTFQYWINELGLAVLAPNVRGSNGYGKSYLLLDNGYKREDSVKDIGAFIDWIGTQPDLNAERIGVFGGSYGGYMVLASMTHYNDRLRAAVDVVGISNFVTFLTNTKAYRRDLRRAEYGDERDPEMRAFLESISPANNARKITKPLFIIQGYNDPRVPVTEAEQMRDVIRANGGDVWYMVAMDEGHGFRKKFNRDYYLNAVSLFWEKYLLD
ncbi:MAG: alpha/beta fold hydrolase [FCB group bacterium]|nr:alpha/beta fold hydrolase [FCB group bacterium]